MTDHHMDVKSIIFLPPHLHFIVYDKRPGGKTFNKARKVVAMAKEEKKGTTIWLAFDDDSTSFYMSHQFRVKI